MIGSAKRWGLAGAICLAAPLWPLSTLAEQPACSKTEFEVVVEDAAAGLRELNAKNKPAFQDKLRQLKTKRAWTQDQFLAGFILLFAAVLTLVGTVVSDLLLGFIDPRVRLGQGLDR